MEMFTSNESLGHPGIRGDGPWASVLCFLQFSRHGIWTNRFQLVLTMVTMAIGSFGLALTIFLGQGALDTLWADLEKLLGSWVVAYDDAGPERALLKKRLRSQFTPQDLEAVRETVPMARLITPVYYNQQPVQTRDKLIVLPVDGITEPLSAEPLYQTISGSALSKQAHEGLVMECLVTESVLDLFKLDLEKERTILVNGNVFRIVGVIADPPLITKRLQPRVIIPYSIARNLWIPFGCIGHILVAWRHTDEMEVVIDRLQKALENARGPNTFMLNSTQFAIRSGKQIVHNFMGVAATQSLFCILIASFGIINIMLTNVSQRAHEFAIRVAMGATQQEIFAVMLLESLLLGILGACLGLVLATLLAPGVGKVISSQIPEASRLKPLLSIKGFAYPMLVCGISGLLAGILPALRVRKLDVLKVLRYQI